MVSADDTERRSWPEAATREGAVATVIGRYQLGPRIAVGGMGTVNFGLMTGAAGFSRIVAIKRLHAQYSQDPDFAARFREEIWLSARILHPNVVQVLDVIQHGEELLFAMEYVHGDTLRSLHLDAAAQGKVLPPEIVAGILVPALHGLHAAHQTRDDLGNPLGIVHRDVSPQNILVGRDGQIKMLDFGIAKAALHSHATRPGRISGKVGYLSPEQALGWALDARSDVFAAGTVLWEALVGARLFRSNEMPDAAVLGNVLNMAIPPPRTLRPDIPEALERVVLRALERAPEQRFASASELAFAIEAAIAPASAFKVGKWFAEICAERIKLREELLATFREPAATLKLFEQTDSVETHFIYEAATSTQIALTGSSSAVPAAARVAAKKPRRVPLAFALLSIVAATLLGGVLDAHRAPEAPADQRVAVAAGTAVVASPAPVQSSSTEARPSETLVEPSIARVATAELPVASSLAKSPRSAGSGAARKARARQSGQVAKAACQPPTYVDAVGIRHFKAQCL